VTLLIAITVALAAVAVLAAIVIVAVGGGGELSTEHPDHPPLALPFGRPAGGTDAVLLRLPLGLWGYHKQITDEALERFAYELTERDTRIAVLEQELVEARRRDDVRDQRPVLPGGQNDQLLAPADPLATRADRAFGAGAESAEPSHTRTDLPSRAPVTREAFALPPAERPAAEADDTAGGLQDTRPARGDGAE
jgi:hypothetical protein